MKQKINRKGSMLVNGERLTVRSLGCYNAERSIVSKALLEVLNMRCKIPRVPFSANVICLNGETQHSNKSCMKSVFVLNNMQQQSTRV